jgi:hypothetical protein
VDLGRAEWHRALAAARGELDPRYVPEDVFHSQILPALNRLDLAAAYADKNAYERFFPGAPLPPVLLRNQHGRYSDAEYRPLSEAQAAELLAGAEGDWVAKPAIDSGGSKGVVRVHLRGGRLLVEGTPADLRELAARYGGRDFLLQRYLRQHPVLAELHPGSTNTVRILSARIHDAPLVLTRVLKLNNQGAWLGSHEPAGMLWCAIGPSGELGAYGIDAQLRTYATHPFTGVPFAGRAVPAASALAKLAISLHGRLDYFDLVTWEFVVTDDGAPVIVDVNLRGPSILFAQALFGPLFGEHTERVLERVFRHGGPRGTALWPLLR